MKRPLSAFSAAAAALLLLAPGPAHAVDPAPCLKGESESTSFSSVDAGEIRYTDSAAYLTEINHAISAWRYSGSKIKIFADTADTGNDLDFEEFNDPKQAAAAIWKYKAAPGWTDYISINKARMKDYAPKKRRSVVAHELGHALGLCHKAKTTSESLMWPTVQDTYDVPQGVDKANYKRLWG
ncbi:matrixin family metalloprotease [Streptomyces sp. Isolate_45]|uniref:matrixin family metalloprotease n=1 Tax=Streptomyces sp. Isolate_45 TaxID=2950111 RepID=UPI002481EE40|nr:matrixin family metalloprotease [Streptomyces sp. Isolate_45]MDA5286557.1 matrixin family metalloprotease [Streptomyces sp. Isolate_45]